ncbi:MAG: selenide, water dikinase SelD [Candidatus Dadabacteria bacterium]|nr:MAG: selenide, water dikinase SelD [Candidatus Dadabacteria bacterium]
MDPTVLSDALQHLPRCDDPDLLVGFETSDDAAVYRVAPEVAVVTTADYITPVVDDPVWYGRVAAANALSDVWAMGGRPVVALNLVNFPAGTLDPGLLREMLRGGAEKVAEAGACLAGGHTVEDPEPKYGLAVTGVVHPDRVLTNRGARPGDALVLTKPLGTGVIFNANRAGRYPKDLLEADVLPVVAALNRVPLEAALRHEVHALTDITGFGFAGHALEMARGSGVRLFVSFGTLPFYPAAAEMYAAGVTTGSNAGNRRICGDRLVVRARLRPEQAELLVDPQTSGGLLIALPEAQARALVEDLRGAGVPWAAVIGRVEAGEPALVIEE